MKTTTKLTSLFSTVTAIGLAAGIGMAAAAPPQDFGQLFICRDVLNADNYRVTIKGVFPMQYEDAYGYLIHVNDGINTGPGPGGMIYHVVGDDDGDGDRDIVGSIFIPGSRNDNEGFVRPTAQGLEFRRELSIPRSAFNEDDGVFNDADEIYATATFRDGDGGSRPSVTQAISRNFEAAGICDGCCQ